MPRILLQAVGTGWKIVVRAGRIALDTCRSVCCMGVEPRYYWRFCSCTFDYGPEECRNLAHCIYLPTTAVCIGTGTTINGKVIRYGGQCYAQSPVNGEQLYLKPGTPGDNPPLVILVLDEDVGNIIDDDEYECIGEAKHGRCPSEFCGPPGFYRGKPCREEYSGPLVFICRTRAFGCGHFQYDDACFLLDTSTEWTYAQVQSASGVIVNADPHYPGRCCDCESGLSGEGACVIRTSLSPPYGPGSAPLLVKCCCLACTPTRAPSKVSFSVTYELKTYEAPGTASQYLAIWRRLEPATLEVVDESVECGEQIRLTGTLVETYYNPDGSIVNENVTTVEYYGDICPAKVPLVTQAGASVGWVLSPTGGWTLPEGVAFSETWNCTSHAVNYRFTSPDGVSYQTWIAAIGVTEVDAPECYQSCSDLPPSQPVQRDGAVLFLNALL